MTANGRPRWTGRTHVDKVSDGDSPAIEPLRNLPVIKDIAADMTPFFEKWQSAHGRFDGAATRRDACARIKPDSPERQPANAHSALVMAPVVIVHLGFVICAIRGGSSAGEILGRTQGIVARGLFYALFMVSVALHAGPGLRTQYTR